MKILITGATGMLGSSLIKHLLSVEFDIVTHGMKSSADVQADLRDANAAYKILSEVKPDAIVHLVGCTNVDLCEKNQQLAWDLNVRCLRTIANMKNDQTRLIHISTDHVYDGPGYNSENRINLKNVYAVTKRASELIAESVGGTILRTNFFGRSLCPTRKSISDWAITVLGNETPVTLFTDVMFSPLSMSTLSNCIKMILNQDHIADTFNVGSRNGMSKRNFVHTIAKRFNLSTKATTDVSVDAVDMKVRRPNGMMMDSSKFEMIYSVTLPTLEQEILSADLEL